MAREIGGGAETDPIRIRVRVMNAWLERSGEGWRGLRRSLSRLGNQTVNLDHQHDWLGILYRSMVIGEQVGEQVGKQVGEQVGEPEP